MEAEVVVTVTEVPCQQQTRRTIRLSHVVAKESLHHVMSMLEAVVTESTTLRFCTAAQAAGSTIDTSSIAMSPKITLRANKSNADRTE